MNRWLGSPKAQRAAKTYHRGAPQGHSRDCDIQSRDAALHGTQTVVSHVHHDEAGEDSPGGKASRQVCQESRGRVGGGAQVFGEVMCMCVCACLLNMR